MPTGTMVRQLNREVKTLRRDVTEIKSLLVQMLAIPRESIREYRDAARIRKALAKALKKYPVQAP